MNNLPVVTLKKQIARKIARLLECAHFLDLNRGDGDFKGRIYIRDLTKEVENSGDIFYVIDTNFINAFLRPKRWYRYSRLFHNHLWSPLDQEDDIYQKLIMSVGSQCTLLATEFVISTELNGAKGRIYMSREHYMELARQLEFFKKEAGNHSKPWPRACWGSNGKSGKSATQQPQIDPRLVRSSKAMSYLFRTTNRIYRG